MLKCLKYTIYLLSFLTCFVMVHPANAAWYDASWAYRKKITVTGQSGAGTNYQVKLLIGQSSGSAGTNFHLENHSKTDFSDLRFTASDQTTSLDYWIESTSGSSPNQTATVWVEVAADLGTNQDIYVYYGNAAATNASSGANTFMFFDDFSGDLSKWSIDPENTDKVSISSGALRQDPDTSQTKNIYFDNRIRTASFQMADGAVDYKVYLAGATNRKIHQMGWRVDSLSFGSGYAWRLQNSGSDSSFFEFANNAWTQIGTNYADATANTWYNMETRAIGSNMQEFINGTSVQTVSDNTTAGPGYIVSHLHGLSLDSSDYVLLDDVRVRKIVATEPAYSTVTIEQTNSAINVYYSVGQSSSDMKTGTPTVTISGGAATFSMAQTGNIGVGDRVTYDTDNKVAYIAAKTNADQTHWNLVTKTGGTPVDVSGVTVNSITHEYTSLSAAVAGAGDGNHLNSYNLVTGNYQLNFPCYYDSGADTTAVNVIGYTTGANNYIKIYTPKDTSTEANQSQRHSGKWDSSKYQLAISTNAVTLQANSDYMKIDGLQIKSTSGTSTGIAAFFLVSQNITLTNNIIVDAYPANSRYGIYASGNHSFIYNNLIYGFSGSSSSGIYIFSTNESYIYNNTINNCVYGINGTVNTYAKNNIAQNVTDGYYGTFNDASNYNISDLASDAPGANSKNATEVAFADEANKDFHLAPLDTAAREAGTDLSADANLPFNTDIDANTRPTLGSWDIGADEGSTAIYRSVAPDNDADNSLAAITTGTNNGLTISGSMATFQAPLPDNVGVGDALQYDSDNNGSIDAIAFIYQRIDSAHYIVKKFNGTVPTAISFSDTDWGIFRAYTSLAYWQAGTENTAINATVRNFDTYFDGSRDIKALNEQWNVACYKNGTTVDTTQLSLRYWNTSPQNYIRIFTPVSFSEVGVSQRHTGIPGTGYQISVSASYTFLIYSNYVVVDGLEIPGGSTALSINSSTLANSSIKIGNSLISTSAGGYVPILLGLSATGDNKVIVYNSVLWNSAGGSAIDTSTNSNTVFYVYNSTIAGRAVLRDNTKSYFKNVISNTADAFLTYTGTQLDCNYCALKENKNTDWTSGSNNTYNKTFTFINEAGYNYHLANADASAKDLGMDLSTDLIFPITTDIDGQPRMSGSAWDIGADERLNQVYYSVGQSASDMKTGTPTVTISSGVATFSTAQTGNIGVGDRITYNTTSIAYIAGKIDQSNWYVVDKLGDKPADVSGQTVNSITREYTSLSGAITGASDANHVGNSGNLLTSNVVLNIPCYYDTGADTTVVDVTGYTTAINNYIKIYTPSDTNKESNFSQRHTGKWDDTKYNLTTSTVTSNTIRLPYTQIIGLQISNSGDYSIGLYLLGGNNSLIDSSIIKAGNLPANALIGINSSATITNSVLKNSIVYGYKNGSSTGFKAIVSTGKLYVYNVTVAKSYYGFYQSFQNIKAVNTISYQNTVGHNFSLSGYISGTDYNASDLNDAPGTNSKNNQTFNFVDANNNDFHLASNDTAARDAGIDLRNDINFPITSDIDGNTRYQIPNTSYQFDIGADEGATVIYRSVGPSATSALTTGASNAMTISGSVATFASSLADNIGVGDAIQYDSDNNGSIDALAFIQGRTDSQHYLIKKLDGSSVSNMATGDNDWSIFRAYISLANAETGTENTGINASFRNFDGWNGGKDIFASNEQWNIACYANGTTADTTATAISGWNTSQPNYLKVYTPYSLTEVGVSQRHQGKWDTTKYYRDTSSAGYPYNNFGVMDKYVRLEGMQILYGNSGVTSTVTGITVSPNDNASDIQISNSIIQGNTSSTYRFSGIHVANTNSGVKLKVFNNIFYNISNYAGGGGAAINVVIFNPPVRGYIWIYNNTIKAEQFGIRNAYLNSAYTVAKNNIIQGCADGIGGGGGGEVISDYNISDIAGDVSGANSKNATTVAFVDTANNDFHLASTDTAAKNAGVKLASYSDDPNLNFSTDIDGEQRTGNWSIGADEPYGSKAEASHAVDTNLGIDNGLMLYQSFDGSDMDWSNSSGEARDKSGNIKHGDVINATSADGARGQGLSFNGSSAYVSEGNVGSGIKTIAFWMKASNVVSKKIINFDGTKQIEINGSSNISATNFPGTTTVYMDGSVGTSVNTDWHLIVVTDTTGVNGSTVELGRVGTEYFSGMLDEVRFYNRVLSTDEIGQLYRFGQQTANASQKGKYTNGLVGHWTFDGPDVNISTNTANDVSGQGNNGTISNATQGIGILGQGMSFNASTSYINAGSASSLDDIQAQGGGGMSVSFWVKPNTGIGEGGTAHVVCKGYPTESGSWCVTLDNVKRIYFDKDYATIDMRQRSTSGSVIPNEWQHIVVTWDGSSTVSNVHIYSNGAEVTYENSVDGSGIIVSDAAQSLFLGNNKYGSGTLDGNLDDVRIYNRVLTPAQVGDLYRLGQAKIKN